MGELEEKETPPSEPTPQEVVEEPKETDRMLERKDDEQTANTNANTEAATKNKTPSPTQKTKTQKSSSKPSSPTSIKGGQDINGDNKSGGGGGGAVADGGGANKINGEEIINIPDDDDDTKVGDGTGDAAAAATGGDDDDAEMTKEGREVKPKKIPIGGIKMPGFFTKTKSRGDGDGAEGELLQKETTEKSDDKSKKDSSGEKSRTSIGERIRNFFVRKPAAEKKQVASSATIAGGVGGGSNADDAKSEATVEATNAENGDGGIPQKRGLLNAIKLPIANMIPKKKNEEDVELGASGPGTKAGLASMETLDDSLKDQDCADKTSSKNNGTDDISKLKVSPSGDIKSVEEQKQIEDQGPASIRRLFSYKCSKDDAFITLGVLLFLVLIAILGFVLTTETLTSPPIREGRFIEAVTGCGMVEGIKEEGVFVFRGIPYAVPPLDEYRWKPAKPFEGIEECWNGTLKTHNATAVCSQMSGNGTIIGDEDCLTLDVITPHVRYDSPVPVIVLIGAESFTGGSPGILTPSLRDARLKDVIFVRPNFRLGAFGFLALEALSNEPYPRQSGNYALSDIIAALNWVKLNIINFGGDPKSVVLFGHRAGATLVSALVTSPKLKDLYSRAWVSSGSAVFPGRQLQESERRNQEFMNQIQCKDTACLREATTQKIWDSTPDTWLHFPVDIPTIAENTTARHEWLVLDGTILIQHPADAWKKESNDKPKLVMGTTAHMSHTDKLRELHKNWTADEVRAFIQASKIGALNLTDEVIKNYNATDYKGLAAIITDIRTICPLLTNARLQNAVPLYVVTQGNPIDGLAKINDDVQAILGRYDPETAEQRQYVSAMQNLFYHYVTHGEMPQFVPTRRVINVGQEAIAQEDYPNCNYWISHDFVPRYARLN